MIAKNFILLAFFAALVSQVSADTQKYIYPLNDTETAGVQFGLSRASATKTQSLMAKIKYFMLSGNLDQAKLHLLHANYQNDFSTPIQYRYMAIIHFIEGNYAKSLGYLNRPELDKFEYLKKNCVLKSLNLAILNKKKDLELFWPRCREATLTHTTNLHLWIETLISLQVLDSKENIKAPFENLAIDNTYGDFLRIYMKLALYLGQQDVIFPRLPLLSIDVYKSDELRELIGLLFYRDGQLVSTYSFIEDLDTPNAENIKGNIYLAQKKYELAYAQFKLALNKKSNSTNALERAIPIAWKLRQWSDGLFYLHKYEIGKDKQHEKATLMAAFYLQRGEFKKAQDLLLSVVNKSKNGQSAEVNKLLTYSYLHLKDKENTTKYANASCKQKDGIGCWLVFQLNTWEDFTLTATREDKILGNGTNLANQLKENFVADPIEETIYIAQSDIEELENAEINLLPLK